MSTEVIGVTNVTEVIAAGQLGTDEGAGEHGRDEIVAS
jgi:hypothetical protein